MANPHRGEVDLELGDKTYVLRPSFAAIAEIEARTRTGLIKLVGRYSQIGFQSDVSVTEMTAILHAAISKNGEKPPADLGDLLLAEGALKFQPIVAAYLTFALHGDRKAGREGEAAAPANGEATNSPGDAGAR